MILIAMVCCCFPYYFIDVYTCLNMFSSLPVFVYNRQRDNPEREREREQRVRIVEPPFNRFVVVLILQKYCFLSSVWGKQVDTDCLKCHMVTWESFPARDANSSESKIIPKILPSSKEGLKWKNLIKYRRICYNSRNTYHSTIRKKIKFWISSTSFEVRKI